MSFATELNMLGEGSASQSGFGIGSGTGGDAPDRNERPLGGGRPDRNERPLGAARAIPAASTTSDESKYGSLTMGGYVPTTREIESGAVVVEEVQAVKDTDSILTPDLQPLEQPEEQFQVSWQCMI